MKKTTFLFIILLCCYCFFAKHSTKLKVKISICDIKATKLCYQAAPEEIILIIGFKINKYGIPIHVVKLSPSQPFIDFANLKDCLKKWRIEGAQENSKFVAEWKFYYGIWKSFTLDFSGEKIIELDFHSLQKNSLTIYKRPKNKKERID